MSNQKKSNNYESEILGNGIIAVVKPFFKYIKLSCRGIKKVYLSKLQGNLNKSILTVWLSIEGVCIYNLLFNSNVNTWLISGVTSAVVLPCLNFLQVQKDINNNEWFYELYNKLGFKEDYENNISYPYFLDMYYDKNLVTYKFLSNNNKLENFTRNVDLIEEYLVNLFEKYNEIIEIKRHDDDKRIIEIVATNIKLTKFYKWGSNLVPKQGELLIGKSINGDVVAKWNNFHHILVVGEVGGGKTVAIKNIIMQLIHQSISSLPLIIKIADFKGAVDYNFLNNTFEVITDKKRLMKFTETLIIEMDRRIELIKSIDVENVDTYNSKVNESEQISRIVLVIDELVECLDKEGLDKKKDSEEIEIIDNISRNITKLARLSRCININMILGTQLPTSSCLGNQLKNNIPARLCGRFADESASRVALSSTVAKNLPDIKGRMMFKMGANITELQTPFLDNDFMKYYLSQNKNNIKLHEIENFKDEVKEKQQDNKITFEELQRQKLKKNKDKNIANK